MRAGTLYNVALEEGQYRRAPSERYSGQPGLILLEQGGLSLLHVRAAVLRMDGSPTRADCAALDWAGAGRHPRSWSIGPGGSHGVPWGLLTTGAHLCYQVPGRMGALTVEKRWDGESIAVGVTSWRCTTEDSDYC